MSNHRSQRRSELFRHTSQILNEDPNVMKHPLKEQIIELCSITRWTARNDVDCIIKLVNKSTPCEIKQILDNWYNGRYGSFWDVIDDINDRLARMQEIFARKSFDLITCASVDGWDLVVDDDEPEAAGWGMY